MYLPYNQALRLDVEKRQQGSVEDHMRGLPRERHRIPQAVIADVKIGLADGVEEHFRKLPSFQERDGLVLEDVADNRRQMFVCVDRLAGANGTLHRRRCDRLS